MSPQVSYCGTPAPSPSRAPRGPEPCQEAPRPPLGFFSPSDSCGRVLRLLRLTTGLEWSCAVSSTVSDRQRTAIRCPAVARSRAAPVAPRSGQPRNGAQLSVLERFLTEVMSDGHWLRYHQGAIFGGLVGPVLSYFSPPEWHMGFAIPMDDRHHRCCQLAFIEQSFSSRDEGRLAAGFWIFNSCDALPG